MAPPNYLAYVVATSTKKMTFPTLVMPGMDRLCLPPNGLLGRDVLTLADSLALLPCTGSLRRRHRRINPVK
eukprot:8290073-Prorocentrum_lima.AAC.1